MVGVYIRPCYTVKQVSRYLYHVTFVSWSLSVYTLNQVACFMQNLFTNCSRQNGESWQWRHYYPCLYFANCCWNSAIHRYFVPFPVMFYLPCADHVILFVHDVVTSWLQTKISDRSEIKCIVILTVPIQNTFDKVLYIISLCPFVSVIHPSHMKTWLYK